MHFCRPPKIIFAITRGININDNDNFDHDNRFSLEKSEQSIITAAKVWANLKRDIGRKQDEIKCEALKKKLTSNPGTPIT